MRAVLTQSYLAVEDLEPPDPVDHPLELDALDVPVLVVHPLHPEDVVAEVQALEPAHTDLLTGPHQINSQFTDQS